MSLGQEEDTSGVSGGRRGDIMASWSPIYYCHLDTSGQLVESDKTQVFQTDTESGQNDDKIIL